MVCPAFCSSTWRIRGNQLKKTPYFCNKSDVKFESTNMDFHGDLQLARRLSPHSNFKLWHSHLCTTSSYDHLKILQRILLPLTLVTPKQGKSPQPVSLHSSADLTRKAQYEVSIVEKEKSLHATSRSNNPNFNWPDVKTSKPPATLSFCTTRFTMLATSISLPLHGIELYLYWFLRPVGLKHSRKPHLKLTGHNAYRSNCNAEYWILFWNSLKSFCETEWDMLDGCSSICMEETAAWTLRASG